MSSVGSVAVVLRRASTLISPVVRPRPVFCVRVTEQSPRRAQSMVRPGKEPADADALLDQHEALETVQDSRWLNGVNRQLRPDAPSQRQAASAAAAAKRKAGAMSDAERKTKDAERNKRNRAAAKEKLAAAAAVASVEEEPCTPHKMRILSFTRGSS